MSSSGAATSHCAVSEAEAKLRAAGYRLTPQRRAVLNVFFEGHGHLTAAQVHSLLRVARPNASLVTVYRTLELLTEARILSRLNLKDGAHRYELSRECSDRPPAEHPADGVAVNNHHHHILCTQCGAVAEFDGCIVDALSERLEQLTGFNITDHWMEMWGLCARCKLGTNDGQQTDTEEC